VSPSSSSTSLVLSCMSASPASLMQRTRTSAPPALGRRRQLSPPHASVPVWFPSAVRSVLVSFVRVMSRFTSKAPATAIASCQQFTRNRASLFLRIHPSNQRSNFPAKKFPTFYSILVSL
jgi:hypothetical protein